jgi:hypothetical protein
MVRFVWHSLEMDISLLSNTYAVTQAAQGQDAAAISALKMQVAAEQSIAALLSEVVENAKQAGIGENLDIRV